MSENTHNKEQWQLLHSLRSTVEGLLIDGVSNVWNVYGGLNRLHSIMEQIFKHGCRIFDPNGEPDCWIFIQGLNWLQPSLATSPILSENEDYLCNLPARITSKKDMLWLYKSLEGHSLSHKLSWLLSDKEHLLSCLEPWAFLCQENLAEATLLYLRAVERNQPVLLAEIDPCLFLPTWISPKTSPRRHRRSSSYPANFSGVNHIFARDKYMSVLTRCQLDKQNISQSVLCDTDSAENQMSKSVQVITDNDAQRDSKVDDAPLKTWNSLPALAKSHSSAIMESSAPNSPTIQESNNSNNRTRTIELAEIINVNYSDSKQPIDSNIDKLTKPKTPIRKMRNRTKAKHSQSKKAFEKSEVSSSVHEKVRDMVEESRPITITESMETKMLHQWMTRKKTSFLVGSAPEFTGSWSLEVEGQKDIRTPRKSFMEDGGSSVQPMATGYFPRPAEGQSLTSFLSSARFSRAHDAELDRENAHFSVCEAMIAAIEQVKCNRLQRRLLDDVADDESDEEINRLKQRIRLRRRQRQEEKCQGRRWSRGDLLSDGRTDTTTTTDQSVSPLSTSSSNSSDSVPTEDSELDDEQRLKNGGMSASTASLFSDAESRAARFTDSSLNESSVSAEGVALSLISRFSEKQLPRASELQWLVSEKDAPQRLLPMPKSWPVSPDEIEIEDARTIPLRGTIEWAPPRPQIIFTPHPPPVRRTLIAKQNYRCAGCGMKVAVKYANRFRYCEYLGRYFCTGCHTNQVAFIPGKILSKWDFNRYPVSNFSYRLLDQMMSDPLFQVNDLNPLLYRRMKQLDKTRLLRTKLFFLKDFLFACRFATSLQDVLKKEPNYIINDPHVYSIQDLINVKLGVLFVRLQELVQICCAHIVDCELCQARGFVCELCCSKDVIFPWDLSKVIRCEKCGACFHIDCKHGSDKVECPRCVRLHARRISRDEKP
ncbi:Run domain Beclin-1 interacting and cystein-rich containing protein [Trachymyrmex septentrionalis]|uniref:Run domain Beclin-1 interacting and cystein-rich containing protein n=1 Tax=Trachymyrmex septentrionalis TaxID=34720 RepID=A0A195FVJ4_9HYME|nr:PREDICTED: run domain Beclin-1-interacting and cysteine-rich domain-containing protein [Trachymyrmex septentrionalis]XP_018350011.1 PREDICTED: run domain Beclin-1-interacting and cysteine-rich domain-containing protein [Trachymyrmex septentrionalis]XP_018350020.1 PREDICTED: run domain Beclin-1-interacting and cysteine-rich domain-containing protein [Trachymyrmex septentrionalis]XP_018350028.1 PREDICTED: run domain Beclin-1-interacting and cysteine-rich domain-containing protein [Trachymyrmex 